jgi:hypothetical protein
MVSLINSRPSVEPPNGAILYRGPSRIDGKPIVLVATGIADESTNGKTGAMIQTWIMREDIAPHHAIKTGDGASVCGDCPSQPATDAQKESGDETAGSGACYVLVFQAPRNIWQTMHRGRYIDMTQASDDDVARLFEAKVFRLGSYGNPSAVPADRWQAALRLTKRHAGYDHMWRNPANAVFAEFCMASVDSEAEALEAQALGWRTFRVKAEAAPKLADEVTCPASKEAGHRTTCADCCLCGGKAVKTRKSIVINSHGHRAKAHRAK